MTEKKSAISYEKAIKRAREGLKKLNKAKERPKSKIDEKNIGMVIVGDWSVIVPWQIIISGESLSNGALRMWLSLSYHARKKDYPKTCYPSMRRLADFIGKSEVTSWKYINELKTVGLIKDKRRGLGETNIYTLINPEEWWTQTGKKLKIDRKIAKKRKYKKDQIRS